MACQFLAMSTTKIVWFNQIRPICGIVYTVWCFLRMEWHIYYVAAVSNQMCSTYNKIYSMVPIEYLKHILVRMKLKQPTKKEIDFLQFCLSWTTMKNYPDYFLPGLPAPGLWLPVAVGKCQLWSPQLSGSTGKRVILKINNFCEFFFSPWWLSQR